MKTLQSISVVTALFCVAGVALTGCSGFTSTAPTTIPVMMPAASLHGTVHGGQQPITGSTLQLYAAGNSGYGIGYHSGASGLIPSGSYYAGGAPGCVASSSQTCYTNVISDSTGGFSITGDYTCPTAATEVYLVATGGNPGPTAPANPNIALMAALGPCGNLSGSTNVAINEITTVGSVWALSPFMTGIANIGTSSTNPKGLTNAFATVNKLVNTGNGVVPGPALPVGASVPVAKINTLADLLASCINSGGGTAGDGSSCGLLFTAATVCNALTNRCSAAPTDTITAAMNMAQNPNANTTVANNLNAQSPFQPMLMSAPNDFSLVITYSGGGLSTPKGIATDASGNVWVANSGGGSVTKFDALGINANDTTGFLSGANGYAVGAGSAPAAIAIDTNGNAWVANTGNSTVSEISGTGSTVTPFSGGGLSSPTSVAIDANNNVWIANSGVGGSVTEITPGATPVYANYTGAGIAAPTAITINPK
jgi:hypothetical protein